MKKGWAKCCTKPTVTEAGGGGHEEAARNLVAKEESRCGSESGEVGENGKGPVSAKSAWR